MPSMYKKCTRTHIDREQLTVIYMHSLFLNFRTRAPAHLFPYALPLRNIANRERRNGRCTMLDFLYVVVEITKKKKRKEEEEEEKIKSSPLLYYHQQIGIVLTESKPINSETANRTNERCYSTE